MVRCPAGHDSAERDYCDVCGDALAGAAGPAASRPGEKCPRCGTPRDGRYCEVDRYDFDLGAGRPGPASPSPRSSPTSEHLRTPSTPTFQSPGRNRGWKAMISADREYYDKVMAEGGPDSADIVFPLDYPARVVPLTRDKILIGRRSQALGVVPEIDLSLRPEDIAVSHIHAELRARQDGTWVLVDHGSKNGTTINDSTDPIAENAEIAVGDGDRIHVGAWTTITLRLN
jgi:hypothetical protein